MVLGSKVKGLTYPKSVYLSTTPYGFFYIKHALALPFSRWTEGDDKWLAELFGLSYEKKVRPEGLSEEAAWEEFVKRVEGYLTKGVPVQTFFGWTPRPEFEKKDMIVSPGGSRAFWWEGLSVKTRPDTHSFVIVGLDRENQQVTINMPMGGWFGLQKYLPVKLSLLHKRIEPLRQELKYTSIAYVPTGAPPKDDKTIANLVTQRIEKKLRGAPTAYADERHERIVYGVKALEAFKEDLNPRYFFRILEARSRKQGVSPLEIIVLVKLALYQQMFTTSLAAEYLEGERKMAEWEWLSDLTILYHKLYIETMKLVTIFRSSGDKKVWDEKTKPVLKQMQNVIDEMIAHMKKHRAPQQV